MNDNINAMRYQHESSIAHIRGLLSTIEQLKNSIHPVTMTIKSNNNDISIQLNSLRSEISKMQNIVSTVTSISSDPVLMRTIEDLVNVSNRFDNVIDK
jgi:methyl-accepting chemotaxis protein